MLGLGTLLAWRARSARTSPPPRSAIPPPAGSARGDPRHLRRASRRCSRTASPTRCTRPACRSRRARWPNTTRVAHRRRDPSGGADRRCAVHRPRRGRRDRRDRGDRRQRDALPGRDARRHRASRAASATRRSGRRRRRLGREAARPDHVGHGAKIGANSVVIHDVPANSTVVGNPGHPVRVDGRRPEGPDADWAHLPDPVADAIKALSERLSELEGALAELTGRRPAPRTPRCRPLRRARRGADPAGG